MQPEPQQPSRLAVGFVVVGLALTAISIAYIVYAGRERHLPPIIAPPGGHPEIEARIDEMKALLRLLIHSFVLFLAFLLGSYAVVRVGRRVLAHKRSPKRTEYIDAWANYRLTQDQIDAVGRRLEQDFPPSAPPEEPG